MISNLFNYFVIFIFSFFHDFLWFQILLNNVALFSDGINSSSIVTNLIVHPITFTVTMQNAVVLGIRPNQKVTLTPMNHLK